MAKEIEFRILPNGKIEMDMIGFQGEGCSEEAKKHIERLGIDISDEKKPEFYEGGCQKEDDRQHNRGS